MDKRLSINQLGGGVRTPHDVVIIRLEEFFKRKFSTSPGGCTGRNRQYAIMVLVDGFNFRVSEVASAFELSNSFVYRELNDARFFYRKKEDPIIQEMIDYIIYNAKYTPL